jgi:hypothetical protein
VNQKEMKRCVDFDLVCSVKILYQHGHYFKNDDELRGALILAYQQGLDGMGKSISKWMGLNNAEYNSWMRDDTLPRWRRKHL